MNVELIIALLTALGNFSLGLVTYLKNPKSATNKLLAFLALQVGIWAILNYLSLHAPTAAETLFWIRVDMLPGAPMGPTIYLLVRTFPQPKLAVSKQLFIFFVILVLITMLLAISPFMFTQVFIEGGNIRAVPGPAIVVFAINFIGLLVFAFITLIQKYKQSIGLLHAQLKFLLFGLFVTFTLIAIGNLLFVILLKTSLFVPLGPTYSLILIGSISYAIIKHRFLDIRLVVARTVSYSLLTIIVVGVYTFSLFVISQLVFPTVMTSNQLVVSVVLSLLIAYSFQPLRKSLEKVTDRLFFQENYEPEELLGKIARVMAVNLELDKLIKEVFDLLTQKLHLEFSCLSLIKDQVPIRMICVGNQQKLSFEKRDLDLASSSPEPLIVFDDLEEGELKQWMRRYEIGSLIKLITNGSLIGVLIMGHKLSGDILSNNDIRVLEILGPELAIAVQNASQFEEIKQFSQKLQVEVERATKDLHIANDRLSELDKLKSEFVSVASHELRTPMTAIKSYLWMALAGRGGNITDKQKYYLERAYISTDRLIKLVNDLLNVSRIESGKLSLDVQKLDLGKFIEEVIAEVKPRADELGISVVNEFDFNHPIAPVIGDADKLKEVVINLIGNSLKFTAIGGKIRIWFELKENMVFTHVTDNGEGISPDDLPKLFQKFGLVKESYVTNQKAAQGTGLGLYISKSIIEMHRGKMWAESEGHGKGATFIFTLPVFSDPLMTEFNEQYGNKEGLGIIHSTVD